VGLESIKKKKGSSQQPYIPVLLELKNFRNQEINLLEAIAAEFKTCRLPRYEEWTLELLKAGKLLILLDGLDEVPTEQMSDMVMNIQNFVDLYDKNRFIVSCRTAAYRNNFRRFSDVAVANFDDEQIEGFIKNWFHSKPELAEDCWEKLKSSDYQAAKELAQTPVLLTLICVLYQRSGQFPTNRGTLYERALRVLLEEWNAAKEIPQTQIYKGLDTKRKELLLSEIAYSGFVEDRLFFQKRDLSKQIEKILPEMLPDEKLIDGYAILRDIEVQHGILVERAESIYSFSHLTIQEFLTALYLYDDAAAIVEQVVNDQLFDQRWREVFLLLAGLKNNGDALLLTIEKRIQEFVLDNPKLQAILEWVEQVVDPTNIAFKEFRKREIAIKIVISISIAFLNIKKNTFAALINIDNTNIMPLANGLVNILASAHNIAHAKASINELKEYLDYIERFKILNINLFVGSRDLLDAIEQELPTDDAYHSICLAFRNKLLQTYREVFLLTPELVDLSKDELEQVDIYLKVNGLLIDCRANAVRVRCWQDIESRMLLPVRPKT
jgi:predicted NACHT family NTPase